MELGVNLGYFGMGVDGDNVAVAKEADRLGYSVAWAAEAYGSDVPTVLAWIGAQTERIGLGAAVMQIPGRTPAMTAMTAATLDTLSGGRFRLGLGVSGPQVSEGWHGVRFDAPLGRTREYVDIVRMALRRETVAYQGKHFTLPLPDGPGKALKLTVHPPRPHIPLYLAAVGPKNLELAGEVADGWHAIFFSPEHSGDLVESVRTGRRRAGHGADGTDPLAGFDIAPSVPVVIADDVEAAADAIRPYAALYVGGMGSREQNFYNRLACRMGFEEAAATVQDLYLAKQHRDAAAAVPFEFIDDTTLIGPPDRIRDRLQRYADAGVGTLSVAPFAGALEDRLRVVRTMAELMGDTGSAVPAPTKADQ
ncbi:LLM class F420-dependent oxidoreductase [Phycicoccus sp. 3266]|jgi:F420-dependent oxidoreductase-like protein|uniref:LLM class F420-dependent oxidoreductase n=1 Tax=Phycicoccus sp. 3266 TaxID=2817751 RepID=UPI002855F906|nr:LLM class F420-dependent oxidoreductase [Phycicoccus sp. 3266]MDR6864995.1 F420-dependent oxidoreductase-like protein [Phycicoccus sp. 3266]